MKFISSLLFLLVLLGGCGANTDSFIQGVSMPMETLDEAQAAAGQTLLLMADVFAGLEKVDGDNNLQPGVAKSFDVSDDGLTYTFYLRDDVSWVDNEGNVQGTLTANDFEYSYKRMVDPNTSSVYSYIFEIVENASDINTGKKDPSTLGVTAIDDYTLEIRLDHVAPYFESMLAFGSFFPASQAAVEKYGDDYGTSAETTWYSGAYYVTSYDPTYSVTLQKNPEYYDADNVQIENIEYRVSTDSTASVNAFDNGELDYTILTTDEELEVASKNNDIHENMKGTYYMVMNMQENAKTSNETLRHALAYGFDRESIVSIVYGDLNEPVEYIIPYGVTPSSYDGLEYRTVAGDSLITYDKERADTLFDEYMDEQGFTDRSQIELTLLANSALGSNEPEAIQAFYKQTFGITINIVTQPYEQFTESARSGAFDLQIANWGADYGDPSTYLGIWQSSQIGGQNKAFYANDEYDKLYAKADAIQDPQTRFEQFSILEKMLVDEAIAVPYYQNNSPYLITEGFNLPHHLFLKISHEYLTYDEGESETASE